MLNDSKLHYMNKVTILSITLLASLTIVPTVYAEEQTGFFDWLMNLFGGEPEKIESEILKESQVKQDDIKKAVIIDQLDRDIPNKSFQNQTMEYFTKAGYEVDLYTYDDITIDFLKNLPSMDYDFIVFRSHALAIYGDKPSSWLFTGEKYTEKKYIQEQLAKDLISRAVPYRVTIAKDLGYETASQDRHFIVSAKFVQNLMIEKFPNSVIILGGCDTLAHPDFGHAFIERGASSVIGWNGLVGSYDNDQVIMSLVEEILFENSNVDDAVDTVMEDYLKNHDLDVRLRHYASGIEVEV